MLILIHVLSALSSVILTSYLIFRPNRRGLNASYGLVASTVTTGFMLIVFAGANILSTCISGLLYVAAVSVGLVVVNRRLATENSHSE